MTHPHFRPLVVALLFAWVSIVIFAFFSLLSEKIVREERQFDEYINSVVSELKNKLDTNEAVLAGFSAFLQAVDRSDEQATMRYAASTTAAYPHIYMMEVARRLPIAEQRQFEAIMQKEWRHDFALKSFSEITQQPSADVTPTPDTWPILFMYPALPEAKAIYGLRLETVSYLAHTLAISHGKARPVASQVFELYEGGSAYILLQEVTRRSQGSSGGVLDFYGNTMAAMLVIKGQSLAPSGLDMENHKHIHISAKIANTTNPGALLFERATEKAFIGDTFFLPSYRRDINIDSTTQPIILHFEQQLMWRQLLSQAFVTKVLLLLLALIVIPWVIMRHYKTLGQLALEHEKTAYLATYDQLTDLPNRFLFADRFTQAFHNWKRNGSKFAFLIVDLDHFKEINDTHGHEVGDQVLIAAARRMKEQLRSCDTIARYGGDEFAALLLGVVNADEVGRAAEKLLDAVSQPITTTAGPLQVSCSIGIAICPTHGETLEELRRAADQAMYESKKDGRNAASLFSKDLV